MKIMNKKTALNKTLLFLVTEDWYFISHRLPIAIAAKQQGYNVVVVCRETSGRKTIEDAGLTFLPLTRMVRSSINPFSELTALLEIISIYREVKPDIAHQVALKPVIYGGIAGALSTRPSIVNALGGLGFVFSSQKTLARMLKPVLSTLFKFALRGKSKKLILQNDFDRSVMLDNGILKDSNIVMIKGAGANLNEYSVKPLPEGSPIVLLAARLLADKGVKEFVDAGRVLSKRGKDCRFVLAGQPDLENPTSIKQEEIDSWVQEGVIEYWGHQNDMPKALAASSIFVLPSLYGEGLPKVLIEAAACGRAIVTTDHPGCRDAIVNDETGILIEGRNVDSLVRAVEHLIDNKQLCESMGLKGRKYAEENFAIEQVIEVHLSLYQQLQSI
ncbi:glycosyltransferase family 4 protein [Vibrio europaeus]|uniref:glycosyltransferase family 4 protein n=1 Tax=Vibrio europaeus TaxID=300876 RepID=UPI0023422663|nr:glycosyltransferase family 4 protein [Vibrio europaeus]MDC5850445.1 glycosyltransferase family 4 protein [Vibrio europaeus]